jgi:hypothetical protein
MSFNSFESSDAKTFTLAADIRSQYISDVNDLDISLVPLMTNQEGKQHNMMVNNGKQQLRICVDTDGSGVKIWDVKQTNPNQPIINFDISVSINRPKDIEFLKTLQTRIADMKSEYGYLSSDKQKVPLQNYTNIPIMKDREYKGKTYFNSSFSIPLQNGEIKELYQIYDDKSPEKNTTKKDFLKLIDSKSEAFQIELYTNSVNKKVKKKFLYRNKFQNELQTN